MGIRKLAALAGAAAVLTAACSGDVAAPAASAAASGGAATGCKIGMSWNNYQEERWAKWDEPAIKEAIAAGGGDVHLERREVVGRDSRRPTSRT